MEKVTTVGIGLAKTVFSVHGVNGLGRVTLKKTVSRVRLMALLVPRRARAGLVEMRTAVVNRLRGLLSEFGVVLPVGTQKLRRAMPEILEDGENGLPGLGRKALAEHYALLVSHMRIEDAYGRLTRKHV